MIYLESRRKKLATIQGAHRDALVVDVTSKGPDPWVRFSPFFPHGGIPVPFSPRVTAQSVEGIWQGLKVFEHEGVDLGKLSITTMKGIKRSGSSRGKVKGHQRGVTDSRLIDYLRARLEIYLPSYRWLLEHRLSGELALLEEEARRRPLVLLDYETNADVADLSRPLSHASLIKRYLEGRWPTTLSA